MPGVGDQQQIQSHWSFVLRLEYRVIPDKMYTDLPSIHPSFRDFHHVPKNHSAGGYLNPASPNRQRVHLTTNSRSEGTPGPPHLPSNPHSQTNPNLINTPNPTPNTTTTHTHHSATTTHAVPAPSTSGPHALMPLPSPRAAREQCDFVTRLAGSWLSPSKADICRRCRGAGGEGGGRSWCCWCCW